MQKARPRRQGQGQPRRQLKDDAGQKISVVKMVIKKEHLSPHDRLRLRLQPKFQPEPAKPTEPQGRTRRATAKAEAKVYCLGDDRFEETTKRVCVFGKILDTDEYDNLYYCVKKCIHIREYRKRQLVSILQSREEILQGKYGEFSEGYSQFKDDLLKPDIGTFVESKKDVHKATLLVTTHHYTPEDMKHHDFSTNKIIEILTCWMIWCIEWIGQGPDSTVYERAKGFCDFLGTHFMFHYRADLKQFQQFGENIDVRQFSKWRRLLELPGMAIPNYLTSRVKSFNKGKITMESRQLFFNFRYEIGCAFLRILFLHSKIMEPYFPRKEHELQLTLSTEVKEDGQSVLVPLFPEKYLDPALHFLLDHFLLSPGKNGRYDQDDLIFPTKKPTRSQLAAAVGKLAVDGIIGNGAPMSLAANSEKNAAQSPVIHARGKQNSLASLKTPFTDNRTMKALDTRKKTALVRSQRDAEFAKRTYNRARKVSQSIGGEEKATGFNLASLATFAEHMPSSPHSAAETGVSAQGNASPNPDSSNLPHCYAIAALSLFDMANAFARITFPTTEHRNWVLKDFDKICDVLLKPSAFNLKNVREVLAMSDSFLAHPRVKTEWQAKIGEDDASMTMDNIRELKHLVEWQRRQLIASEEVVEEAAVISFDSSKHADRGSETVFSKASPHTRPTRKKKGTTLSEFKRNGGYTSVLKKRIKPLPKEFNKKAIVINEPDGEKDNNGFGNLNEGLIGIRPKLRALIGGLKYQRENAGDDEHRRHMAQQFLTELAREMHRSRNEMKEDGTDFEDDEIDKTIWDAIDAVPLPETSEQLSLAGCLFTMDNFMLIRGIGSGGFGHAFMACLVDERGDPDLSLILCIKFEIMLTYMLENFRVPITDACAREHKGINETHGYFIADTSYVLGDPHDPGTYCVVGTLQNLGDHTVEEDMFDIHDALSRCFEDDSDKLQLLFWIIRLGSHLFETVDDLHSKEPKLTHRDIKPENIISCDDRNKTIFERDPKKSVLIDWGLARVIDARPLTDFTCGAGTEPYLPPTHEEKCINADVWALLQSLIELLLQDVVLYNKGAKSHSKENLLEKLQSVWGCDDLIASVLEALAETFAELCIVNALGTECAVRASVALKSWKVLEDLPAFRD